MAEGRCSKGRYAVAVVNDMDMQVLSVMVQKEMQIVVVVMQDHEMLAITRCVVRDADSCGGSAEARDAGDSSGAIR